MTAQSNVNDDKLTNFSFFDKQFWSQGLPQSHDIKTLAAAGAHPFFVGANGGSLSNGFGPALEGRSIATNKFRLVEFSAFMQNEKEKHLFVHIGQSPTSYSDPLLESVDIRQIYDKFPEKKGLKELYDKGPQSAFFLVKFWADLSTSLPDDSGAFYGVTSQYESNDTMTISCSTKVCSFGKQVVEKVEVKTLFILKFAFFFLTIFHFIICRKSTLVMRMAVLFTE